MIISGAQSANFKTEQPICEGIPSLWDVHLQIQPGMFYILRYILIDMLLIFGQFSVIS
jgi:hypothetical protein